ncbi:DUF5794 domain-containing protein [Halobaculum sp. MBLA0147]|uniref:DUF5794 domain-containing protein n=1 Tax=Halobaculum sp. MBLA0147 TaxID=3079934 RepID=UPI0035236B12
MSTSRHPVAYRLEQLVGGPTKLLATVMALPLVDGIFPALVLAGTLEQGPLRIVETGLLIFGGSATMAVILAEMDGSRREQVASILVLAAVLLPVAAVEAAMAETIRSLIDMPRFKRFAALVILAVAAKTASAEVGELLPRPAAIIGLGLLASVSPAGFQLVVELDPGLMVRAAAAAGVGVAFALGVALTGPKLRGRVDIDRFRFGSAVALGVLGLSILELGIVGSEHPVALGVLLVTMVFSYDPSGDGVVDAADGSDDDSDGSDDAGADGDETAVDEGTTESGRTDPYEYLDDDPDTLPDGVAGAESDPDRTPVPTVDEDATVVADGEGHDVGARGVVSARESWGTEAAIDPVDAESEASERTDADGVARPAANGSSADSERRTDADVEPESDEETESGAESDADPESTESADPVDERAPWL